MIIMALQETGKDVFSLPITAKSLVPPISLLTPLLDYRRCFLDYPYTQEAELRNDSNLPVNYVVPEQTDKTALAFSTPHPAGIIQPHSTLKLPIEIKPKIGGEITLNVPISIMNSTEAEAAMCVKLSCIGEGPVVFVTPSSLRWGRCPVLTSLSKVVTLANQSVIPAEFECAVVS